MQFLTQQGNELNLEYAYQRRLLKRMFSFLETEIEKQLNFIDKNLDHLEEQKQEVKFYFDNLLKIFESLNFSKYTNLSQNTQIKVVEDLISATFDEKMEDTRMKNLKELLILWGISECDNIALFLQQKENEILIEGLKKHGGFKKINFDEFLLETKEKNTERLLEKYIGEINPLYPVNKTVIQQIKQTKLIHLRNQLADYKQKLSNEDSISQLHDTQIWGFIEGLRFLLEQCYSLYSELYFTLKNINIISLKLKEIRFLSFYLTSDRQLRDIMNVIFRNKKLYFDLIIKIYESDKESTERDIKIVELIQTMVEEISLQLNTTLMFLRTQNFVEDLDPSFTYGSRTVTTNIDSHTFNCLVSSSAEQLRIDFEEIKKIIENDLQKAKIEYQKFLNLFQSFIEERRDIKNSQKGKNIELILGDMDFQMQERTLQSEKIKFFIDSLSYSEGPKSILVFKIDQLLNEISSRFEISKDILISTIASKILSLYYLNFDKGDSQKIIDFIFIPYETIYQEIYPLIESQSQESFCIFLANWMIQERINAFSPILKQSQTNLQKPSSDTINLALQLFKKCWIAEYCRKTQCSYQKAEQFYNEEFNYSNLSQIKEAVSNFKNISDLQFKKLLFNYKLGSNIHQGLGLLE